MMGTVLKEYPSKSNPNKTLGGNKTYTVRKVINAAGKVDTYLDLQAAIDRAVKELT